MNILATFQNDPWKFTDVRVLTVIFHVWSWKMQKKLPKFFLATMKKPELILINMFKPTYMPNLVTLAWKMSSGMSKEAGSLSTYSIRQNLHDRTRLRSLGNKCPCQVWKWSAKNYGRESVDGGLSALPPAHPLGLWGKNAFEMLSGKRQPFCLSLNVLISNSSGKNICQHIEAEWRMYASVN